MLIGIQNLKIGQVKSNSSTSSRSIIETNISMPIILRQTGV